MQNINEVFEPVEVIAHFDKLKVKILRFKWKSEVYKVTDMLQSWKIPKSEGFVTHFIVICGESDMMCELSFCNTDMKWEIVRYDSL